MAEFQEMMRGWTEICKNYGTTFFTCGKCPVYKMCMISPKCRSSMDIANGEAAITEYIKHHPLPSTPTWIKWMMDNGLIDCVEDGNLKLTPLAYYQMDEDAAKKVGAIDE